jgi:hypothetical protein
MSTAGFRSIALGLAAMSTTVQIPALSLQIRNALDRTIGSTGTYVAEESAYRFVIPTSDVSLRMQGQTLRSGEVPVSWIAFCPSIRRQVLMTSELVLLENEASPAIAVALKSALHVTGLGARLTRAEPTLLALDLTAEGSAESLGLAVRHVLDEVHRVRTQVPPAPTVTPQAIGASALDASPLNVILSMNGTVSDGVYRATIGRVALLDNTPIGREMGMRTSITMFGDSERAWLDAELVVDSTELSRVLIALTDHKLTVGAIRNHLIGEHPAQIFVSVSGQGTAAALARGIRSALDAQVSR